MVDDLGADVVWGVGGWMCFFFFLIFFLMIRRPPRSTLDRSSAASDVYKRQVDTHASGTSCQADPFRRCEREVDEGRRA
mgnify:CR=1 FL=1